jgi:hypothetical protein
VTDSPRTIEDCYRQWQGRFAQPAPARRKGHGLLVICGLMLVCVTAVVLAAGPTPYPQAASVLVPAKPVAKPKSAPPETQAIPELREIHNKIDGLGSALTTIAEKLKSAAAQPPIRLAEGPPPAPIEDKPPAPPTQPPVQPQPVAPAPIVQPVDPVIRVEAPTSRPLGKIIVVRCSQSLNVAKMLVDIEPPIPLDDVYQSDDGKDFVFSVPDEGTWTVRVTASSPNGGLDRVVRQVTVGEGVGSVGPSRQVATVRSTEFGPTDYVKWIGHNAGLIKSPNRKGDLAALAGAYKAAETLIRTNGIRSVDELGRFVDGQADAALGLYPDGRPGPEMEACAEFRNALNLLTKNDFRFHDLAGVGSGLNEIVSGLLKASR